MSYTQEITSGQLHQQPSYWKKIGIRLSSMYSGHTFARNMREEGIGLYHPEEVRVINSSAIKQFSTSDIQQMRISQIQCLGKRQLKIWTLEKFLQVLPSLTNRQIKKHLLRFNKEDLTSIFNALPASKKKSILGTFYSEVILHIESPLSTSLLGKIYKTSLPILKFAVVAIRSVDANDNVDTTSENKIGKMYAYMTPKQRSKIRSVITNRDIAYAIEVSNTNTAFKIYFEFSPYGRNKFEHFLSIKKKAEMRKMLQRYHG